MARPKQPARDPLEDTVPNAFVCPVCGGMAKVLIEVEPPPYHVLPGSQCLVSGDVASPRWIWCPHGEGKLIAYLRPRA